MRNILLVDDDPGVLEIFPALLRSHFKKTNFLTAGNGLQAVKILDVNPVDLIISDLHMPVMDGFELARFRQRHYPYIPLILITADPSADTNPRLLALGVRQFITKPFDMRLVVKRILQELPAAGSARWSAAEAAEAAEAVGYLPPAA